MSLHAIVIRRGKSTAKLAASSGLVEMEFWQVAAPRSPSSPRAIVNAFRNHALLDARLPHVNDRLVALRFGGALARFLDVCFSL